MTVWLSDFPRRCFSRSKASAMPGGRFLIVNALIVALLCSQLAHSLNAGLYSIP
jgi:hypothetical protein